MDMISKKIKQWIDDGKDPRSAHWQGGLEALLNLFSSSLEPGKLIPVQGLDKTELDVFKIALRAIDLSPNLSAAFLPPSVAGKITPPESADELQRIHKNKPSYKILITRPGKEMRILCIELSDEANKPGVDIFQSGALLGTYDFDSQEACLKELTRIVRAHIWERGGWTLSEYKTYTVNWFEKALNIGSGDVPVEKNVSFLHSPTLIKSNRVDAIFTLIVELLNRRFRDPDGPFKETILAIQAFKDKELRSSKCNDLAERSILELLNCMRSWEIVQFDDFTAKESEQFKTETSRAVLTIMNRIAKIRIR